MLWAILGGGVKRRAVSRATMSNIRQNLVFVFCYNVLAIPIAAGLLYPLTSNLLPQMVVAQAMALSSVSIIVNSLRFAAPSADAGPARDPSPATATRLFRQELPLAIQCAAPMRASSRRCVLQMNPPAVDNVR